MFEAALTREGMESVWDAVEEAAGSGVIIDTRLVSQDDGVQVTLDLDKTTLDVAAFLRRLPGAEIYWRRRGDTRFHAFGVDDFRALRETFAAAERLELLDR